jgi:serine/threonine-protein kinase
MGSRLPQRAIGRYELLEEVGRGVTAVVYKARDSTLGRTVALKTIAVPPAVLQAEGEAFERRFFTEARVAARLSHPGLVAVHDVGRDQESGRLYIAFEYVEGRTLDALSGGQPLDWREALRIVERVADALHHAHANGVVHRDLKPANILITAKGDPKVLDFGVAKVETSRMRLTQTAQFFGSPLYLSPEQVLGKPADARSDIFALGAILYRLLTGQHAFAAETIGGVMDRITDDNPTPPGRIVDSLPASLDAIVARALAKAPDDRHASAGQLAADIQRLLSTAHLPAPNVASATPPPSTPARAASDEEAGSGTVVSDGAAPTYAPVLPDTARDPATPDRTWFPGEHTIFKRRASVRVLVGGALLLVVGVLHFARGRDSEPRLTPQPTSEADDARPTVAPLVPEAAQEDSEAGREGPDPWASVAGAPARVFLDFEHSLESGTLLVFANGERLLERALRARPSKRVLVLKLRRERVREVLELAPGRKRILVQVSWKDQQKSQTIVGTLKPAGSRRLQVRLSRVGKDLLLDWR